MEKIKKITILLTESNRNCSPSCKNYLTGNRCVKNHEIKAKKHQVLEADQDFTKIYCEDFQK
jgi:hypothetical protein